RLLRSSVLHGYFHSNKAKGLISPAREAHLIANCLQLCVRYVGLGIAMGATKNFNKKTVTNFPNFSVGNFPWPPSRTSNLRFPRDFGYGFTVRIVKCLV